MWNSLWWVVNESAVWYKHGCSKSLCHLYSLTHHCEPSHSEAKLPSFCLFFPRWQLLSVVMWESLLALCWRLQNIITMATDINTQIFSEEDFTTCKTKHGPPLVRIQFETQIGLESSVNAAFVRSCFCKGQIKAPKSVLVEKGEGKRKGRVKNTSSQCSEQGR